MFLVRPGQMTQWTPIHHNGPSFLLPLSAENGRLWKRSWNCCWSACKCSFASFGGRYWWLCWLHDGWLDRLPLGLFFEVCTAVWNKYVLKYVLFETRMLYWSSLHVCMVCIYIYMYMWPDSIRYTMLDLCKTSQTIWWFDKNGGRAVIGRLEMIPRFLYIYMFIYLETIVGENSDSDGEREISTTGCRTGSFCEGLSFHQHAII